MAAPLVLVVVTLLLTACGAAAPAAVPSPGTGSSGGPTTGSIGALQPSEGFAVDEIAFTDGERAIDMSVFVADDAELRSVGLMHRTELPADAGMLFVFEEPTQGGFWMKDTLLPLSIAFVRQDGVVQQIMDMDPCTADPCPSYPPDGQYLYAVEANQGFFAANGIEPGWRLELGEEPGGGP